MSRPARDYRVEALIERGLIHLGETIDHLGGVDKMDRDHLYVRALSEAVLAAVAIGKEQRAAVEWLERRKLKEEDVRAAVREYIGHLSPQQFAELVAGTRPAERSAS